MIYDQNSKIFKKFLRPFTMTELVTKAAKLHACKHRHPVLTEAQAEKFFAKEATRRAKIEKEQWSSWEDELPQLYMDTYDLRQQRTMKTLIQGQPVHNSSEENEVAREPDLSDQVGDSWQLPMGAKKGATSSTSSYPWLPDPQSSTLHDAGAPTGTPFLGAAAEIETSVNLEGWNWREMPGDTNDEKWFHFVYRKPLRGYENDPFFTKTAADCEDGGNPKDPM